MRMAAAYPDVDFNLVNYFPSIVERGDSRSSEAKTMKHEPNAEVDAIRYLVLQKLAAGLRHSLLGELQAIQFSAELAARLLQRGEDLPRAREKVSQIPDQCTVAAETCRSMIGWLRPEEDRTTTVTDGIRQCVKIAGDDWAMRGIEATTHVPVADVRVAKAALQELVITSLLVLTDMQPAAIDIDIDTENLEDKVEIRLRARPSDRDSSFPPLALYRKLEWVDLELLARVHGVSCSSDGDAVALRFFQMTEST